MLFVAGLEVIGKVHGLPRAFARLWLSFLKTEAGVALEEKALSITVVRRENEKKHQVMLLSQKQVGFASSTCGLV